jgi:hypothetical protein
MCQAREGGYHGPLLPASATGMIASRVRVDGDDLRPFPIEHQID